MGENVILSIKSSVSNAINNFALYLIPFCCMFRDLFFGINENFSNSWRVYEGLASKNRLVNLYLFLNQHRI